MALWGIATPSLQTIMTRLVDATEQGRLQGALASLVGLASLIGPMMFTETFAVFISASANWALPGAPFLLAAVLKFGHIMLAWPPTPPFAGAATAPPPVRSDRSQPSPSSPPPLPPVPVHTPRR